MSVRNFAQCWRYQRKLFPKKSEAQTEMIISVCASLLGVPRRGRLIELLQVIKPFKDLDSE